LRGSAFSSSEHWHGGDWSSVSAALAFEGAVGAVSKMINAASSTAASLCPGLDGI